MTTCWIYRRVQLLVCVFTYLLVSFPAVYIRVVTQCSSPTNGCSLELCIPFLLSLRTNNMHVTVSSCTNHISRYICRQRSRFPRNGSLFLIGQFKERNAELEWAAVSWGGTLRDDPNNGCEGEYISPESFGILKLFSVVFSDHNVNYWVYH